MKPIGNLEHNENPFAIVTMAHLKTKATHNDPESRKAWKFRLTTMLYERGYKKQDILELYNFLDYMMTLPESLSQQFDLELEAFEETKKMKYVSTLERRILARAEAEAEVKQARSMVKRQLTRRFDELSDSLLAVLDGLSIDQLESLGESLLDFTTIDDLTHWLATR
jgi:CII-binding regulator of phage lambda lysogenization HflD